MKEFYTYNSYVCRRFLDITVSDESKNHSPDIIVFMLNPGSASEQQNVREEKPKVKPDPTIRKLQKLMSLTNVKKIRILNLSDLREPKINEFYSLIKTIHGNYNEHSIFHENRRKELIHLLGERPKILLAWGTDDRFRELRSNAIKVLKTLNVTILNEKAPHYHPLSRQSITKINWVDKTIEYLRLT